MKIYHNSRDERYRSPKGAVPSSGSVRISLEIGEDCCPSEVILRLWDGCEKKIVMQRDKADGGLWYTAAFDVPSEPCLLWYYFIIRTQEKTYYYSNNQKRLGGVGQLTEYPTDISYQITVFDKDFKTPEWFKKSIMYQIFPDRFYKAEAEALEKKTQHCIHSDWYEPLFFDGHPYENGPACNDFYGGNFKGIMEKLGYLKELGISVIYLNPIFEAFSNHRYDTGDYSKTDPILGSEDDFKELCKKAEELGIRIILDGVFSHTGSDSIYFNKYKTYGTATGAMQSCDSDYVKWFQWNNDGSYNSWWGCSNLPNVNEMEPTYIDYILTGENAIIKKWLRLGASGWRLDVADELPDEFIKILRSEVKSEKNDAVVIGEVWEDASNKVSYGCKREYLFGAELDGVMNYPFKDGVIGFLNGRISAEEFSDKMQSIMENYPDEVLYSNMNLLGTHDTRRIKTVLGGQFIDDGLSREEKQKFRLDAANETLALKRLRIALLLQMTFVGVPSIYYGDEIGMQGLEDPFNRMPYTWRSIDPELLEYCRAACRIRNNMDCLSTGSLEFVYAQKSMLIYLRRIDGEKDVFGNKARNGTALCVVNCSDAVCEAELELADDIPDAFDGCFSRKKLVRDEYNRLKIKAEGYSAEIYVADCSQ